MSCKAVTEHTHTHTHTQYLSFFFSISYKLFETTLQEVGNIFVKI